MINFKSLRFEMYVDGKDRIFVIRGELSEQETRSLNYVWFVMYESELVRLTSCYASFQDGYHNLNVTGDSCLFYDMEVPSQTRGEMCLPFLNASIPSTFRKILRRYARRVWAKQEKLLSDGMDPRDLKRHTLELTEEQRNRVCRLYGQGKGNLDIRANAETLAYMETYRDDEDFQYNIDRLKDIARGSTCGHHQFATLHLYKDYDTLGFRIIRPNNKYGMNGALVNHGKDGKSDWSIHT